LASTQVLSAVCSASQAPPGRMQSAWQARQLAPSPSVAHRGTWQVPDVPTEAGLPSGVQALPTGQVVASPTRHSAQYGCWSSQWFTQAGLLAGQGKRPEHSTHRLW
jgi:hypothetical protein